MEKLIQGLGTSLLSIGMLLTICVSSYNPYTLEGGHVGLAIVGLLLAAIGGSLLTAIDKCGRHERNNSK